MPRPPQSYTVVYRDHFGNALEQKFRTLNAALAFGDEKIYHREAKSYSIRHQDEIVHQVYDYQAGAR